MPGLPLLLVLLLAADWLAPGGLAALLAHVASVFEQPTATPAAQPFTNLGDTAATGPLSLWLLWLVPPFAWGLTQQCLARQAQQANHPQTIARIRARRLWADVVAVGLFAATLACGLVPAWNAKLPSGGLVAETLVLVPWALAGFWMNWAFAPCHERWLASTFIRKLDRGQPLPQVPHRFKHAWRLSQIQSVATAVPAFCLLGLVQFVHREAEPETACLWLALGLTGLQAIGPQLVMWVLPTKRLPDGPTAELLEPVNQAAGLRGVRIRWWDTDCTQTNALATGTLPGFRFVLVTDGLLHRVCDADLQAVVAHELAHLKLKHQRLMGTTCLGVVGTLAACIDAFLPAHLWAAPWAWPAAVFTLGIAWFLTATITLQTAERQADAHAARFIDNGVKQMHDALVRVVLLQSSRGDWAHGSPSSRLKALRRTLDVPPGKPLPVDRKIAWLRWGGRLLVLVAGLVWVLGRLPMAG